MTGLTPTAQRVLAAIEERAHPTIRLYDLRRHTGIGREHMHQAIAELLRSRRIESIGGMRFQVRAPVGIEA